MYMIIDKELRKLPKRDVELSKLPNEVPTLYRICYQSVLHIMFDNGFKVTPRNGNYYVYKEDIDSCIDIILKKHWREVINYYELQKTYHRSCCYKLNCFVNPDISNERLDQLLERYNKIHLRDKIENHIYGNYKVILRKAEQEFEEEWNNSSLIKKIQITNDSCKGKTAPTLSTGWFIYILLMIVEILFYNTIGAWIFTTIGFIIWRWKEILKYN